MREVTLRSLRQNRACRDRYTKLTDYLDERRPKYWPDDRRIPVSYIIRSNGLLDALWAVVVAGAGRVEIFRFIDLVEKEYRRKVNAVGSLKGGSWASRRVRICYYSAVVYSICELRFVKQLDTVPELACMFLYAVGER